RLPAVGGEPRDPRLRIGRLDELDPRVRPGEENGTDVLVGELAHRAGLHPQDVAIEGQRPRDRRDDDRDVMELARLLHPRSAGMYAPNAARRSAQISARVTSPSTAAMRRGMRFS